MKSSLFNINQYNTVSPSFIKGLQEAGNPAKYVLQRSAFREPGFDLQLGKAVDIAVLDPDNFDSRVKVLPKTPSTQSMKSTDYLFCKAFLGFKFLGCSDNRAAFWAKKSVGHRFKIDTLLSKIDEGGDWHDKLLYGFWSFGAEACISQEMKATAWKCRESVMSFQIDRGVLTLGEIIEESIIQPRLNWTNEATGVPCRGEADFFNPSFGGFDLKKCFDASYRGFGRRYGQMDKMRYVQQVAAYDEAFRTEWGMEMPWYIVAVEDSGLHHVSVWKISPLDMQYGLMQFSKGCAQFKYLKENNLWDLGYEFDALYRVDDYTYEVESKNEAGLAIYDTDLYSSQMIFG